MKTIRIVLMLLALPIAALAIDVCQVTPPTASLTVPYVSGSPALNTDPHSATWANAASAWIEKDCTDKLSYPDLKTEVRGFWTDTDLYLLFSSPYKVLNLWLPADNSKDRLKLWDKDVVEFFLGDDWQNIRHYREFEIAPTGDWVDLAIDLDHDTYGAEWNSGFEHQGRIDGLGEDPQRHFMCWQQTCVVNRDPNHVPENFGTIMFSKDPSLEKHKQ